MRYFYLPVNHTSGRNCVGNHVNVEIFSEEIERGGLDTRLGFNSAQNNRLQI